MANDLSASKHRPLPQGLLSPGAELDARTTTTLATTLTRARLAFDATAGLRVAGAPGAADNVLALVQFVQSRMRTHPSDTYPSTISRMQAFTASGRWPKAEPCPRPSKRWKWPFGADSAMTLPRDGGVCTS
jgi:hypothetical protein